MSKIELTKKPKTQTTKSNIQILMNFLISMRGIGTKVPDLNIKFKNSSKFGGGGGIRTLAALTSTNDLANRPLQPLGYSSRH